MSGEAHPLTPKSGDTLRVIALGRISTVHQDVENIAASYRYIQSYLIHKIYHGPLDIKFLGEQPAACGPIGRRSAKPRRRSPEAALTW